jgi:outer membrane immunogenic protein
MRKPLTTVCALAGLAFNQSAWAADMAVKAPPPPVPVFTWTGCYVGGNAGWIGSDGHYDMAPSGNYLNAPGAAAPPNAAATGDFASNIFFLTRSYSPHGSGGLVGAQVGCNYQVDHYVFGVEGDWAWSSLRSTSDAFFPAFANVGNPAFTNAARVDHISTKLDSLATFRGRAGYAWDRFFVYGTGGLAYSDVHSDANVTFGTGTVYNGAIQIGSASSWQVGWTAGVGGEYAFAPNWSVKAEYLYVSLDSFNYSSPLVASVAAAAPGYAWRTAVVERDNIVRIGVNYKFWGGGGPILAKY